MGAGYRIGIDVGGTFTDLVAIDDGGLAQTAAWLSSDLAAITRDITNDLVTR